MEAGRDPGLEEAEALLDEVEAALARLSDGTYGVCELCGDPIEDDLLADAPTRRSCSRHQS
jgi:DnaK suppressor protein